MDHLIRANRRRIVVCALAIIAFTVMALYFNMDAPPRLVLQVATSDGKPLSELVQTANMRQCMLFCASLQFSPSGEWLLARNSLPEQNSDNSYCMQVWDARSGSEKLKLVYSDESSARNADFPEFQFSPDSRHLAIGYYQSGKQLIDVLDLDSGRRRTFPALRYCFSTNGSQLAIVDRIADGRQRLRIRDTATGEVITNVAESTRFLNENAMDFWNLAFLGDGRTLAFTTYQPSTSWNWLSWQMEEKTRIAVELWDVPLRQSRQIIYNAENCAAAPDGQTLVVTSLGRLQAPQLGLWDLQSGRFLGNLESALTGPLDEFKFTPDGTTLVGAAGADGGGGSGDMPLSAIAAWDVRTRRLVALHSRGDVGPTGAKVNCFNDPYTTFLPNYALCRYDGGRDTVVAIGTGRELLIVPEMDAKVEQSLTCLSLSPNQKLIAAAEERSRVPNVIWEWLAKVVPGLDGQPDASLKQVRCWDLATGDEFPRLPDCGYHFAFSPDSRTLATYSDDGTIKLWDLPPRKPLGLILALSSLPAALVLLFGWWRGRRLTSRLPSPAPPAALS